MHCTRSPRVATIICDPKQIVPFQSATSHASQARALNTASKNEQDCLCVNCLLHQLSSNSCSGGIQLQEEQRRVTNMNDCRDAWTNLMRSAANPSPAPLHPSSAPSLAPATDAGTSYCQCMVAYKEFNAYLELQQAFRCEQGETLLI